LRTVSALFDTYDGVTAAVDGLADMGVPSKEISVLTQHGDFATKMAEGASLGAAIGSVGGILAGLAAIAVPGLGAIVGVGFLVPMLVGAAAGGVAGGIVGSLRGAGINEDLAKIYVEGVRRGSTLVAARVHDDEATRATSILDRCGAIDTNTRREEYASGGWDSFVVQDIWDDDIGREDARSDREPDEPGRT
jgi:hypothetical protein